MLVHHADPERVRVVRRSDLALAPPDHDLSGIRRMVADQALHERALPSAVLAEQRVERSGHHVERDVVERGHGAEPLRHAEHLDLERAAVGGVGDSHQPIFPSVSSKAADGAMAPKTPPCIVTILIAARWLPGSVAPAQSSRRRHSKPRSFASRIVVCTQTSVVMPVSTRLTIPRVREIRSRSVAQNEPLPGLSMITSPGGGGGSGMRSQPGSPRTRTWPQGPGSPMPAPIRRAGHRWFAGRSDKSGRWRSRVWTMWNPAVRMAASTARMGSIGARVSDRS